MEFPQPSSTSPPDAVDDSATDSLNQDSSIEGEWTADGDCIQGDEMEKTSFPFFLLPDPAPQSYGLAISGGDVTSNASTSEKEDTQDPETDEDGNIGKNMARFSPLPSSAIPTVGAGDSSASHSNLNISTYDSDWLHFSPSESDK